MTRHPNALGGLLAVVLVVWAAALGVALGGEAEPTRAPEPTVAKVTPAMLRAQLGKERRTHRAEVRRMRLAVKAAHSLPYFVWWSTRDTRATAEAVWDEQGVSAGERAYWRCVISRESGWRSSVWFGGAEGWRPEYAGSDRVNGLLQMRPYHADIGERVVSYRTYLRTSDPVFSLRKALRLGHGPFFAQSSACG